MSAGSDRNGASPHSASARERPPIDQHGSVAGGPAWHALAMTDVATRLAAHLDDGISAAEARRRLRRVGPNRVGEQREVSLGRLALNQFRSLVVLLLLAAAGIAWAVGERVEAIAIVCALVLNAAIGFGSEWRARVSLARLRALVVPHALVRRDGHVQKIPSAELAPGDLILLEAGSQVPADARLVKSAAFRLDESALTGESAAVDKDAHAEVTAETPLAERRTMVYLGTAVVAGTGVAIVTGTGIATELGRIGQLVAIAGERDTPLERQVETLGRRLIGLVLVMCGVIGAVGILHGQPIGLMLETAISLAVAAVPEGLPAVTTLALAMGLWRLARAGALVRRLPAVETLGSTTVICSDKTGTMTENQMTAVRVAVDGRIVTVSGGGRDTDGAFTDRDTAVEPASDPVLSLLATAAVLVNDGSVTDAPDGVHLAGDPTETALVILALKAGIDVDSLRRAWPRRREIPFDPVRRLMATFHQVPAGGHAVFVKGAPGVVLDLCGRRQTAEQSVVLTEDDRDRIRDMNRRLAGQGLRVLAVAWRSMDSPESENLDDLTFVGLIGLVDPIRPGVQTAISACRDAGVRTIMLTGDQRGTAEAVGRELGLAPEAIRSRVSPEQKLALIEDLQASGEIVAMTGDGVNDAPALARADIGVAMGRHGTDVAREAADLVLTDDNFATIVKAVAEGRVIYANLQKVIRFLFSCNLSEIATIFAAIVLGFPSPLLPLQILWVNIVTDILPALALIRDPAEPDVMRRPPRNPREALITWRFGLRALTEGVVLAAGVLSAYFWVLAEEGPGPRATTVAFMALVLVHPLQAMRCRSERVGWWRLPRNPLSWIALGMLVALQWLAISVPALSDLLRTVPLSVYDWLLVAVGVLWPITLLELGRVIRRPRHVLLPVRS